MAPTSITDNSFAMARRLFPEDRELDIRRTWASVRTRMEADKFKYPHNGRRRKYRLNVFDRLIRVFGVGLKITGLYEKGMQNALNMHLNRMDIYFDNLPDAFDGYTLLHLTDLHYDSLAGLDDMIVGLLDGLEVDLCVFTGDYRGSRHSGHAHINPSMEKVVGAVSAHDGIVATLGNHDTIRMVGLLESMGVSVLGNETLALQRRGQLIHVTGLDDVHCYYSDMVPKALEAAPDGFKVALVHSPEVYDLAADNGYALYLTGHTHAGQIALPGGRPIIKGLSRGRHLAAGLWEHEGMQGYTSSGVGTSGLPVRFNTRGEICLFTLRCKPACFPSMQCV